MYENKIVSSFSTYELSDEQKVNQKQNTTTLADALVKH